MIVIMLTDDYINSDHSSPLNGRLMMNDCPPAGFPNSVGNEILLEIGTEGYVNSAVKRFMDVIIAITIIILLSPLLTIICLMIALNRYGTIIYRQQRSGRSMIPFRIYKFRTMYQSKSDHEYATSIDQATLEDPRVTPLGRLLRKSSIDELPQLFNVLRGNMSLVGPRPHAIAHDQWFSSVSPNYIRRFDCRPGITGLAQVRGSRGPILSPADIDRRISLDVEYIETASIALDLRILAQTFYQAIRQQDAI